MTLPMLCVDEPYASAIMLGLKRWETRTCPPNGDMRPDGVRGFPGVRVNRGDRIIIASTKRRPRHEQHDVNDDLPPWSDLYAFAPFVEWTEHPDDFMHGGMYRWCGPVGVILGTVAVTDVVPIVADCDDLPGAPPLIETLGEPLRWWPEGAMSDDESVVISDQLPWGDWTPGRWAWALADPIPTTEQCPNECQVITLDGESEHDSDGWYRVQTSAMPWPGGGTLTAWDTCPACEGKGRCEPIPVTGHQGIRHWNGEV